MLDTRIDFSECLSMTAISYFLLAIVPTYAIAEIGARGSMNLLAFSELNVPFAVLSVTLLIWIINLIFPALLGVFLIAKFKIQKMIEGTIWTCLLLTMLYSFWIRGLSKVWDEKVLSFL